MSFSRASGLSASMPDQITSRSHSAHRVAIFWDFENCPPPSGMPGYVVVDNLRSLAHKFGAVTILKAYLEISDEVQKKSWRSELQSSGVSLTDCPHNGRKDSVDKMIMVDMLSFAIDNPSPATVVLISGDRDFVYALSVLRNRCYTIVLIVPNKAAPIILRSQANFILEWKYDVLKFDDWKEAINFRISRTNGMSSVHRSRNVMLKPSHENPSGTIPNAKWERPVPFQKTVLSSIQTTHHISQEGHTIGLSSNKSGLMKSNDCEVILAPSKDNYAQLNVEHKVENTTQNSSLQITYPPVIFNDLVEILAHLNEAGNCRPLRSEVGHLLIKKTPLFYKKTGVPSFKKLVELAVQKKIIIMGGNAGSDWIAMLKENK